MTCIDGLVITVQVGSDCAVFLLVLAAFWTLIASIAVVCCRADMKEEEAKYT